MIDNIGHDGTGVHSGKNDMYSVAISEQPVTYFPDEIKEDERSYMAIRDFLKHRKGNLLQRLIRFVQERF